jgi:hypothetical protein
MKSKFQVAIQKNQGGLYMAIRGDFDGSSGCRLANLLHEKYEGNGEVTIDTQGLKAINPFGCSTFQTMLDRAAVPAERLTFRGNNAQLIAPEGSKIVPDPDKHRCRCNGRCTNCKCNSN